MILARCPACATTFRVRPEQLRARQGRVRCGQCQHAFNALETLVDEGSADEALAHAEPPLADQAPPQPAVLDAFVAAFNARDLDRLAGGDVFLGNVSQQTLRSC